MPHETPQDGSTKTHDDCMQDLTSLNGRSMSTIGPVSCLAVPLSMSLIAQLGDPNSALNFNSINEDLASGITMQNPKEDDFLDYPIFDDLNNEFLSGHVIGDIDFQFIDDFRMNFEPFPPLNDSFMADFMTGLDDLKSHLDTSGQSNQVYPLLPDNSIQSSFQRMGITQLPPDAPVPEVVIQHSEDQDDGIGMMKAITAIATHPSTHQRRKNHVPPQQSLSRLTQANQSSSGKLKPRYLIDCVSTNFQKSK